jgi:hypothetical protein
MAVFPRAAQARGHMQLGPGSDQEVAVEVIGPPAGRGPRDGGGPLRHGAGPGGSRSRAGGADGGPRGLAAFLSFRGSGPVPERIRIALEPGRRTLARTVSSGPGMTA